MDDDSKLLAQVNDSILQQRLALQASGGDKKPVPIGETIGRTLARLDGSEPTADELAEVEAQRRQREREAERSRRHDEAWDSLARRLGRRYAACTLGNFKADTGPQELALEAVRAYCTRMADNLRDGRGALLYGPPGTGKDHLAVAILRTAIGCGAKAEWTDGAEFYGQVRDNIDGDKSESELLKRFTRPDLLVMSDPLPPAGNVDSPFQLSMVFRVIDRRYRDLKATVVTLNVADRAEAERRLSPNIIDRLAHGALSVHCNWPSFRKHP